MCVRAGLPVHEWPRLRWYSVSGVSGMGSHTREGPEGSSTSACTNTSKVRQPAAPSTPAAARAGQARRPTAVAAATVMPFLRNVRRLIISDFPSVWCAFPDYDYSDGRRLPAPTLRVRRHLREAHGVAAWLADVDLRAAVEGLVPWLHDRRPRDSLLHRVQVGHRDEQHHRV